MLKKDIKIGSLMMGRRYSDHFLIYLVSKEPDKYGSYSGFVIAASNQIWLHKTFKDFNLSYADQLL